MKKKKKQKKENINKVINERMAIVVVCVFIFTLFAILKLFYMQIIKGSEWRETAERQYRNKEIEKKKRGRIITSDGEILAYDFENYTINFDPTIVNSEKIDILVSILKKNIPSINADKLKRDIIIKREKKAQYLNIVDENTKKGVIFDLKTKQNIEKEIKELIKTDKVGIKFDESFVRKYISNNSFQEIVGFLDGDNSGKQGYGVERYNEEKLKGKDGEIEFFHQSFVSADTLQRKKEIKDGEDGNNIILTIDSTLQYALDEEMKKVQTEYSAESSMGILIEAETGKILAMSTYPKGTNKNEIKNRPIIDFFEPGSIFKPIIIAMGLQEGVINENSTVYSKGFIEVGDRIIRDHDGSTTGVLTLEKLIALSGNVGMVEIAKKIDDKKFYNYLLNVGFGKKTGIDISTEYTPKLFPYKHMTPVRKSQVAFGQGINMTQLQMLMALNTVINNGNLMKPYIVERIENAEGKIVQRFEPQIVRNVFSPEVSKINRNLMKSVVEKGTGRNAQIPGYKIGGKTGTAQKAGNKGYEAGKYFSSFFSFFPVDHPKYTILVTVNEPKGGYYGAEVALPPVKAVFEKLIKYKGITPQGIIQNEKPKQESVVVNRELKRDISKYKAEFEIGLMPDLTGLSLREIYAIYPRNMFPHYKINGAGRVTGQYPKAGEKISKTSQIIINME